MNTLTLIFSALALVLVLSCLVVEVVHIRSTKAHAPLKDYANKGDSVLAGAFREKLGEFKNDWSQDLEDLSTDYSEYLSKNAAALKAIYDRLDKLEKGIAPDYEQAQAAANAVNDFNRGISAILCYDPAAALRANREESRGGSE